MSRGSGDSSPPKSQQERLAEAAAVMVGRLQRILSSLGRGEKNGLKGSQGGEGKGEGV